MPISNIKSAQEGLIRYHNDGMGVPGVQAVPTAQSTARYTRKKGKCMHERANLITPSLDPTSAMGFPELVQVTSLQSVAHLFGATKKRCGIYFLAFHGELFYVGQAVDVVRRFSQHRKIHDDIVGFSFIPVPKSELDAIEKSLIFKAESIGLKITNAVHVTSIVGDTDFDLVVPITEQNDWLRANGRAVASESVGPKIVLPESQRVRCAKQFSRFGTQPLSPRALALLKQYLHNCVPAPRRTEYSFWSVSCMPSGSRNAWPRLLCVNAALMELFVVGWEGNNSGLLWSFVNVAEDVLVEHWPSPKKLMRTFPFLKIERRDYRDAGQQQLTLICEHGTAMEQLLADPGISKAAATLVLRVMRKRATIYCKYHCPQLADLALVA